MMTSFTRLCVEPTEALNEKEASKPSKVVMREH